MLTRVWGDAGRDVVLRNPAVNGYTTDDLIREELPLLDGFAPTLVTVLIGANDIVAGSDEQRYRAQLRAIHARIVERAGTARRFALPQPDWSLSPAGASFGRPREIAAQIERFNDIARDEVEHAGGAYVDIFPLMREQGRRRMFASDGLHPSAEAYAEWAEALKSALSP